MTDKDVQIANLITSMTYGEMRAFASSLAETLSEELSWEMPPHDDVARVLHGWADALAEDNCETTKAA